MVNYIKMFLGVQKTYFLIEIQPLPLMSAIRIFRGAYFRERPEANPAHLLLAQVFRPQAKGLHYSYLPHLYVRYPIVASIWTPQRKQPVQDVYTDKNNHLAIDRGANLFSASYSYLLLV